MTAPKHAAPNLTTALSTALSTAFENPPGHNLYSHRRPAPRRAAVNRIRHLIQPRLLSKFGAHLNVHMLISIPPKYAVSQVVGYIKGKSAIYVVRVYGEKKRNFVGQHLWTRGYFVSTVGRDETVIRDYIRKQEGEDNRLDQMQQGELDLNH